MQMEMGSWWREEGRWRWEADGEGKADGDGESDANGDGKLMGSRWRGEIDEEEEIRNLMIIPN